MCLVQLHKSSKTTSYSDMSDHPVPARIVTTAYSSSSEKHPKVHTVNVNVSSRRSSVSVPYTAASSGFLRTQRRNTMASGGPARASYVSSRGAAYHRYTEKFFYGRDSGQPLLLDAEEMGSDDGKSESDTQSVRSVTSTTEGVNGSVIIQY